MPPLRRTFSSPSVRSSSYSSYINSSAPSTRTAPRSPRRSSGSDTANRRVLADLDWWRVEEGQRELRGLSPHEQLHQTTLLADDDDVEQEEREPAPVAATLFTAPPSNAGPSADLPLWHSVPGAGLDDVFESYENPFGGVELGDPFESPSTLDQFAALSLNPVARASLHRTFSSSSAFSDVSSDSSFSTPTLSPAGLSLGFSDFTSSPTDDSDDDCDLPYAALSRATRRPSRPPAMSARSVSYSFIENDLSPARERWDFFHSDDEECSSPDSPFSQSFSDTDDVFF